MGVKGEEEEEDEEEEEASLPAQQQSLACTRPKFGPVQTQLLSGPLFKMV